MRQYHNKKKPETEQSKNTRPIKKGGLKTLPRWSFATIKGEIYQWIQISEKAANWTDGSSTVSNVVSTLVRALIKLCGNPIVKGAEETKSVENNEVICKLRITNTTKNSNLVTSE